MSEASTLQSNHRTALVVRLLLLIPAVDTDTTMSNATTYYIIVSAFITLFATQTITILHSCRQTGDLQEHRLSLVRWQKGGIPTLRISRIVQQASGIGSNSANLRFQFTPTNRSRVSLLSIIRGFLTFISIIFILNFCCVILVNFFNVCVM